MPTNDELFSALEKADRAGNVEDAKAIADMIRQRDAMPEIPKIKEEQKAEEPPSTMAALGHGALRGALPSLGGMAGIGAGAALGSAVGPVGTVLGGLAGGFGGGALTAAVQEKLLQAYPELAKKLGLDEAQRAKEEAAHPYASMIGEIAPSLATLRPSGALLRGGAEARAAAINALANTGLGAGMEVGQQAMGEEPIDWTKVGIAGGFGALGQKETALGRKVIGAGEMLAPASLRTRSLELRNPEEYRRRVDEINAAKEKAIETSSPQLTYEPSSGQPIIVHPDGSTSFPSEANRFANEQLPQLSDKALQEKYAAQPSRTIINESHFKEMGIGKTNKALRESILGKDLTDPQQVEQVKNALTDYANGKTRSAGIIKKVESFLERPEFTQPTEGAQNVIQPTEAIAGTAEPRIRVPRKGRRAAVEPTTPEAGGLGDDIGGVGQPNVREEVQPAPLKDTAGLIEWVQEKGLSPASLSAEEWKILEDTWHGEKTKLAEQAQPKSEEVITPTEAPAPKEQIKPPKLTYEERVEQDYIRRIGEDIDAKRIKEPASLDQTILDYVAGDLHDGTNPKGAKRYYESLPDHEKAYVNAKRQELEKYEKAGKSFNEREEMQREARKQARDYNAPEEPDLFRSTAEAGEPIGKEAVQKIVDEHNAGRGRGPDVHVVDFKDLPPEWQQKMRERGAENATGFLSGGGKAVFLLHNNIKSASSAKATLFHETLGHYGLREKFQERLDGVLKEIYRTNKIAREEAQAFLKKHPTEHTGPDRIARAVEEVLAGRQESGKIPATVFARLKNFVKDMARRMGIKVGYSDADIKAILHGAAESAGAGRGIAGETMFRSARQSEAFKKWFGDSKVVDAQGEPVVMYHGTKNFEGNEFRPSKTVNRQGNISGYYFSPDPTDANYYARHNKDLALKETDTFGEGSQVLPTYLSIKKPYIPGESLVTPAMREQYMKEMVSHNQHMSGEKLASWAKSKMYYLDEHGYPYIDAIGNDGDAFQRIIKAGGYDGYKDGRHWVAFEPNQIKSATGNKGTYSSETGDIRFRSEREPTKADREADDILARTGYKTTEKPQAGLFNSIGKDHEAIVKNALGRFLNEKETMWFSTDAAYNNAIRKALEETGNLDLLKHAMYEIATGQAYHASGLATGFLETGKMVYDPATYKWRLEDSKDNWRNMMQEISNTAKKYDMSDDKMNALAHQAFIAERLEGLSKADKEIYSHLTPEQIAEGKKIFQKYPELRKVQDMWNGIRKNTMDVAVESGLYSKEQAKDLLNYMDYVPFYREDQLSGRGANGRDYDRKLNDFAKNFKIKGSEQVVNNIFDNMERWTTYTVSRAVKNQKARSMYKWLKDVLPDEVKDLRQDERVKHEENAVELWNDGQRSRFLVHDPLFVHAFNGVEQIALPAMNWWQKVTGLLRKNIVLNPLFSLSQLPQDTIAAMLSSGVRSPFKLAAEVTKEFVGSLFQGSTSASKELGKYGVTGDFSGLLARNEVEMVHGFKESTLKQKILAPFEKLALASDNAVRQGIYNRTLLETGGVRDAHGNIRGGDKALAVDRAFEIINFKRTGASGVAQILRHNVPFFGAYLQAQNVAYKVLAGKGISVQTRNEVYKTLINNSMKMAALGLIYSTLVSDSKEYKEMDPAIRDKHLLIPGTPLMIPIRSDVFSLPKLASEYTYNYLTDAGYSDGTKVRKGMQDALVNMLLSPTAVPQAVKPLLEVQTNYDFFSGRPIVGQGLESKPIEQQYSEANTSELAKAIGKTGLISPLNVDHLLKGYFGTTAGIVLNATNRMAREATGVPTPEKSWQDAFATFPGMTSFVAREHGTGMKNDFYELNDEVTKAVNGFNNLAHSGRGKEAAEYLEKTNAPLNPFANKNIDLYSIKTQVNAIGQQLTKLRNYENMIRRAPESQMNAEEKGRAIEDIRKTEERMLQNIYALRKHAGF